MSTASDPLHIHKFRRWLFQSPPGEWALQHIRSLLLGALRQGPVPRHVAFVMDGNRRYAKLRRIETIEGHNLGFEALAKMLEICYKAGVEVVTVYAFSTENFKRSKYEVDGLMDMAKTKVAQLAEHGDLLDRYGACIRFLGNQELLRPDVREIFDEAIEKTRHNKDAIFNVCFPYTSREEITHAVRQTVQSYSQPLPTAHPHPTKRTFSETSITRNIRYRQLSTLRETSTPPDERTLDPDRGRDGEGEKRPATSPTSSSSPSDPDTPPTEAATSPFSSSTTLAPPEDPSSPFPPSDTTTTTTPQSPAEYPNPETLTPHHLTQNTYTAHLPPLDLLIRTSGVERLSDFMLWQCHESTSIVFLGCLWPEVDLWRFLPVLVEWGWWRRRRRNGCDTREGEGGVLGVDGGEGDVSKEAVGVREKVV